jgi:hypothetical protein
MKMMKLKDSRVKISRLHEDAFNIGKVVDYADPKLFNLKCCYATKWDQLLVGFFSFTAILLHLISNICDIHVIRSVPCSKESH